MTHEEMYKENIEALVQVSHDSGAGDRGLIIELGVFKGNNTFIMGEYLKKINSSKKYVGFDTFTGYTEDDIAAARETEGKADLLANNAEGRWLVNSQEIIEQIKEKKLEDYCEIVVGDIKKTVPEYFESQPEQRDVSMVYIDCNAYLPAAAALSALKNRLMLGAVIIVDEHKVGGETTAFMQLILSYDTPTRFSLYRTGLRHPDGPPMFLILRAIE